jgi:hypothetical protein
MKLNRRLFSAADTAGDEESSSLDCCFLLLVLVRFAGDETAEERTTTTGRGRERWRGLKGREVWVKKWVDIDEGVDKSRRERGGLRSEVAGWGFW